MHKSFSLGLRWAAGLLIAAAMLAPIIAAADAKPTPPPKPVKPTVPPAPPVPPTAPTPSPASPVTVPTPPPAAAAATNPYGPYRWFYVSRNLQNDKDVLEIESLLQRAHDHGLNGMVLTGALDRIDQQNDEYFERLARVKRAADKFEIEIIPILFSVGYGGAVLSHDRNLAEGFEVKNSPFTVKNGAANLVPDPATAIANGSFEDHAGDKAASLILQEQPGEVSFIDDKIFHDGKVSVRCENFAKNKYGHARIVMPLTLQPKRVYAVSFWVKTQELAPVSAFKVQLLNDTGDTVLYLTPNLTATSDWTRVSFMFNSRDYKATRLYIGVWNGKAGRYWLDGCELHELGLTSVLRRPGTPLTVVGATTGIAYEEGKDFAPVVDPKITFKPDQPDIPITLLPGSRITEGEALKVSWFHGQPVHDGQVSVCMSEKKVYEIWAAQAKLIQEKIAPSKYLFSMDEIREAGSCQACRDRKLPLAEILGDCITRQEAIIREVNPKAEVFVWSDMLDPNHNGKDHYFACEGDFTGAWKSIPKDIGIVCWYFDKRAATLKFFSDLGFRTVAGAYYDSDNLDNVKGWLDAMQNLPGGSGICYTTWENKYQLLDDFGDLIKGYSFAAPAVSPVTNSR